MNLKQRLDFHSMLGGFCPCLIILVLVVTLQVPAWGDEAPFKCLVIYDTREYLNGVHIDLPPAEEPSIEASYDNPVALHWLGRTNWGIPAEFLGSYRGRGIYQRTWPDSPSSSSPASYQPFKYTIFFYQTKPVPGGTDASHIDTLFPFFICDGRGIASVTNTFASDQNHPFSLSIRVNLQGQGLCNSTYRFGFTKNAVFPIDCTNRARRMGTTVQKY